MGCYCIIVTGIPASGKSTLAKELGKRLDLPVFSKDAVKERLYDTLGFQSREEKIRLGIAAMNIMYDIAEQMMKCGKPFLLENNFENESKDGLIRILKAYRCKVLTITLTGDYQVIYQRFVKRNTSPDRHRGHVVNDCYPEKVPLKEASLLSYQDFTEGIKTRGMDRFTINGPSLRIDTTDFANLDIEKILKWIDKNQEA